MVELEFSEWRVPTPYGPQCPGPVMHKWRLAIEEGQVSLRSGCEECDWRELPSIEMAEIDVQLEFHVERDYCGEAYVWLEVTPKGV